MNSWFVSVCCLQVGLACQMSNREFSLQSKYVSLYSFSLGDDLKIRSLLVRSCFSQRGLKQSGSPQFERILGKQFFTEDLLYEDLFSRLTE